MNRLALASSLALAATLAASAQTNSYPFPASGNVGIGTSEPQSTVKLDVRQPAANSFAIAAYAYDGTASSVAVHAHGYAVSGNGMSFGVQGLSDYPRGTGTNIGGYFSASGAANSYALVTEHGNVGIGTVTPTVRLTVQDTNHQLYLKYSSADTLRIFRDDDKGVIQAQTDGVGYDALALNPLGGDVGIGTTSPTSKLTVKGGVSIQSGDLQNNNVPAGDLALGHGQALRFANDSNNSSMPMVSLGAFDGRANTLRIGTDAWPSQIIFRTGDLYAPQFPGDIRMEIANSGNVGIGTTNPAHKLAVNGTIKAKEVIVETTGWSDYVFADGYALQPLAEVEAHIKTNKHLPGIPSAAQVAEQGVSLGDMQAKLLAKIEELTLHQIAQEKELASLRQEVRALRESSAK